ncbi:branched-chain amino acid ABC transporter permease [Saliphagus sp. GCM10025308]
MMHRLSEFPLPLRRKIGVVLFVVIGLLPFVFDTITVLRMTGALYLATFAMTWDFQSGYTGEISFGHAFFFAVGGYTSGIMNLHYGLDPVLAIPIGMVAATLGGLLLGIPTLRVHGPYLSLVTMAAPLILLQVFIYFSDFTGGEVGLTGTENITSEPMVNYYIAFALFAAMFALFYAITRSDTGEILTAIREDEDAVVAAGINPAKYKIYSFVLSGTVGGLAGALLVHSNVGSATPGQLLGCRLTSTSSQPRSSAAWEQSSVPLAAASSSSCFANNSRTWGRRSRRPTSRSLTLILSSSTRWPY